MANISGRLIFDINRNAKIDVQDYGIIDIPIVLQNISTNEKLGVYTDKEGNYTFTNVQNGNYRIVLVYGYSGKILSTPAEFINTNTEVGEIPTAKLPPYTVLTGSYPKQTNTLNAVTPTTIFVTVSDDKNIEAETIFIGPARYESINLLLDSSATISEENLLDAVDYGTFGDVEAGTHPNGGPLINPYPGIAYSFTFVPQREVIHDGYYSIGNTIDPYPHFFWWRLSDHTTSIETGRMEIVNGAYEGASFFHTRIDVDTNTDYVFSAWLINLDDNASQEAPKFGVEIMGDTPEEILYNDKLEDLFRPTESILPIWKEIGTALNTSDNKSIGLNFYSEGAAAPGNDYAVDDVKLRLIRYPVISPVKEVDSGTSNVGNTIQYTVTLDNTNDNPLTDVIFKDPQPSSLEFISGSVTINNISYPSYNPNDGFNVPNIEGKSKTIITFKVKVISLPQDPNIINKANVTYKYTPIRGGIPNTFNRDSNDTKVYIGRAIIGGVTEPNASFSKLVDKEYVQIGDTLTYTIIAQNRGNIEANNIKIDDVIPNGTSYIENSITSTVAFTGSPLTSINLTNPLQPGEQAVIMFQVKVNTLPNPNPIPNVANITYSHIVNLDEGEVVEHSISNTVYTLVVNPNVSIVKSENISKAIIGNEVTYTLLVENIGNIESINTIVKDSLVPQLTFVPGSLVINNRASNYSIVTGVNLGTLNVGDKVILTFKAIVNDTPPTLTIDNSANVTYSSLIGGISIDSSATSNVVQLDVYTPSIEVTKQSSKQEVCVGETYIYTINVTNTSDLDISNVILNDNLPSAFKVISIDVNGIIIQSTELNGLNIGNLNIGETVTILVTILVTSNNINNFKNIVTTSGTVQVNTANPPVTVRGSAIDKQSVIVIDKNPNISIVKSENIDEAIVGNIVTYTLVVKNTGNTLNTNVIVEDKLEPELTFVSGSLKINEVQSNLNITTGVNIGNLDVNEEAILTFEAKVNSVLENSTITNYSTVSYDVIDQSSITSYSSTSNTVSLNVYNTGIKVTKVSNENIVYPGETFNYTITVTNNSGLKVSNVILQDSLPSQLSIRSISVNGTIVGTTNLNGLNIGDLLVGQTTTIVVTVYVLSDNLNNFKNIVTASGTVQANNANQPTTVSGSATDTQSVTSICPNLSICIVKLESTSIATVGKTIIYTIIVRNTGNMTYENTIIEDPLSSQLTFVPDSLIINGVPSNQNIINGVNIGTLNVNQQVVLTFKAVVNSICPSLVISNNANVRYSVVRNMSTNNLIGESNTVYLEILNPQLNIIRKVDKENICVGDIITYTIIIENIGDIEIGSNNIPLVFFDKLCENVDFISDSLMINGYKVYNKSIEKGIILGTVGIGERAVIEFKVKVRSCCDIMIKNKPILMYGIKGMKGFIVTDFVK